MDRDAVFFEGADSPPGGPMRGWELAAIAVCHHCPVADTCLADAMRYPATQQFGVIGGWTAGQRRQVLRLRGGIPTRRYQDELVALRRLA